MIQDSLFDEIDTPSADAVTHRFGPWVADTLHPFLNELPCLRDVQSIRKRWKARTIFPNAFGSFKAYPRHWFTFNHGGRSEAQLNVGMFPQYLRIGLGFEFTEKQGGDPSAVALAFTAFRDLTAYSAQYEDFVATNRLEVEFVSTHNGVLEYAPTAVVAGWEPPASSGIQWAFFGRLLRREKDRHILEDPSSLGGVLESVFKGFKPFWAGAQEQAARWK